MPSKPAAGTSLNLTASISSGLLYAYPCDALPETEMVSGASTTVAGSPSPTQINDATFGLGYQNLKVAFEFIGTQLTAGFCKGLAKYSILALCRVATVPASNVADTYVHDCPSDTASSSRLFLAVSNSRYGVTGIKWMVRVKTGTSTSPSRDVHAGAGGTTVTDNTLWKVIFTFDSDADLFTLYLNGVQEAQLAVAEVPIVNTNPYAPPRFLTLTNGYDECNGSIHGVHFWNRVLTAAEIAALTVDPWLMYRATVTGSGATGGRKPSAAVSGTYTPPAKTGTVAVTAAQPAVVGSGTWTGASRTGTATVAAARPSVAASGAWTPASRTGTAAVTAARPVVQLSGTATAPGHAAVVAKKSTVAAAGTYTSPDKTGTVALLAALPVVSAAVLYTPPPKVGTVTLAGPAPTIASVGAYTPPNKTGTAAVTARRPLVAAAGEMIRVLPPPSGAAIRVVNWLRPAS